MTLKSGGLSLLAGFSWDNHCIWIGNYFVAFISEFGFQLKCFMVFNELKSTTQRHIFVCLKGHFYNKPYPYLHQFLSIILHINANL